VKKLKEWMNYSKEIVERASKGKLTKEDKINIVVASLTFLSIGLVIFLISKYWLPIMATTVLIYIFFEEVKSRKTVKSQPNQIEIVYLALFDVLHDIHDRIPARKPIDYMDISFMPPIIQKNGIQIVRAKVDRNSQHPLTDEDLEIVKKRLQSRINDHLKQGKVFGVPYITPDGKAPVIFIDSVTDNIINYLIDVVVIDSQDKLNYYNRRQGTTKHVRPQSTDKDF